MPTVATVAFGLAKGILSISFPGVGVMRVREDFSALPAVTTNVAQDGDVAVVGNAGAAMVLVAFGSTPDAAATAATVATSAGFPLSVGAVTMIQLRAGDKISVKALP